MLQAILFDFDGLIVDTEMPVLQSWQELYREYGHEVPVQDGWVRCIGTEYGPDTFDPFRHLGDLVGAPIDWPVIEGRRRERETEIVACQPVLPGVIGLLDEAGERGIQVAVASSSPHSWVDTHLRRLELFERFDAVICSEDVANVKPAPDLFLKAAEALAVRPENAIVLEDSPHGILAAQRAGMAGVAVPNDLTRYLDFNGALMRVSSLAELSIDLLDRALQNWR